MMHRLVNAQGGSMSLITPAQVVTIRRALQKLAGQGVIFDLGYAGRRKVWASERVGLRLKIRMMQVR